MENLRCVGHCYMSLTPIRMPNGSVTSDTAYWDDIWLGSHKAVTECVSRPLQVGGYIHVGKYLTMPKHLESQFQYAQYPYARTVPKNAISELSQLLILCQAREDGLYLHSTLPDPHLTRKSKSFCGAVKTFVRWQWIPKPSWKQFLKRTENRPSANYSPRTPASSILSSTEASSANAMTLNNEIK